ncbi:MAG: hypothetical protein JW929_13280 [Anaerolineales bacterium]|nr:hypothetical protein [Anaerolineales bacterium]
MNGKTLRFAHVLRTGAAPTLLAGLVFCAGCAPAPAPVKPADSLPGADSIPGWIPAGEALTFTRETLFDYINGASEYYFTYTFEEVATGRYADGAGRELNAEIWRFAEAEDAYGLFSGREGIPAAAVGRANQAVLETGVRLVFWQEKFYVNLTALDTAADGELLQFAEFISRSLPAGGEKPAILGFLPAEGLAAGSEKFFHMELAIQERIWLGGENLLGLTADTDAVAARYARGGSECQLLLVQYPDSARAEAALEVLRGGGVEDAAAAARNGKLLGAVFGTNAKEPAEALLAEALGT